MAATERRDYAGAAVETTIVSNITAAATSITITDATGWPAGSNGPFAVVIDEGLASEEKVKVLSRSGASLTVVTSPSTGRGYDGTSASSHAASSTIRLCVTAIDLNDANEHIYLTTRDDHTQYLNATRHAAVSHTAAMLASDAVTTAKILDLNVTTGKLAADAVTAAKLADDAVGSEHIQANAVGASELADNAVDTNAIATDAVTNAKIADDAVDTAQLATNSVTNDAIAANAVGSSELADDAVDTAAIANSAVTLTKLDPTMALLAAWTDYTPTLNNWTKGNGTTTGQYVQVGKTVKFRARFVLGSSSTVNGVGGIELPVAPAETNITGTAHYFDTSGSAHFTGVWYMATAAVGTMVCQAFEDGLSKNVGSSNSPFGAAWATGDIVTVCGEYEAA